MANFKGTAKEKAQAWIVCVLIDACFIIPHII